MHLAVLLGLAATTTGQLQFDQLRKQYLPGDTDDTQAVISVDVDGDGDLDLVCGNERVWVNSATKGGQNRLYINDGTGRFTDATATCLPAVLDNTYCVAAGDVDGDGDPDLVFANLSMGAGVAERSRLCLNDGNGRFIDVTTTHLPRFDDVGALVLGDVDGDGDLDLIGTRLFLNDGRGRFQAAPTSHMPTHTLAIRAVELGDVDGDHDLDLILGNEYGKNLLYLNNGRGVFTDATSTRLPAASSKTQDVALCDVDGDGDLDVVFANGDPIGRWCYQSHLYLNDGKGTFTDATSARMPRMLAITVAIEAGDVDGDGDVDLVLANSVDRSGEGRNRLYLNDGRGRFTDSTSGRMPLDTDDGTGVTLGDLDGDGDLDVVFANRALLGYLEQPNKRNQLYFNDGTGRFTDSAATRMPRDNQGTTDLAVGDIDGDGDLDLILANRHYEGIGALNRVYVNDGQGHFSDVTATNMPPVKKNTEALALGDIDGDGDLDLITADHDQSRLYLNNGKGIFTNATAVRLTGSASSLAMGDVDGDGDADLVLGGSVCKLYLNNGSGGFTDVTSSSMPGVGAYKVALGDVDGDRDVDLVVIRNGQNGLFLNNGNGTFSDATSGRMPQHNDFTSSVLLHDFDRDGDLDLFFGNLKDSRFAGEGQDRLYLNNGKGSFSDATSSHLPVRKADTRAVAGGDVDGDGDTDLILACPYERNRLYLNGGGGRFTDATDERMPTDMDIATSVALADMDGDGDLDLVVGNYAMAYAFGGQTRLYLNLLRQLDTPFLLYPGREYRVDAYARHSRSRADIFLTFVSLAPARIPLPSLGTLRIDPTQMLPLRNVVIPQGKGKATTSLTVPNWSSLIGLKIHLQALHIPTESSQRLTNAVVDSVLR